MVVVTIDVEVVRPSFCRDRQESPLRRIMVEAYRLLLSFVYHVVFKLE